MPLIKSMNNLKLICFFIAVIFSLLYFSSCKDDECITNLDCAGICGGSAIEDCEGTCNGSATIGSACDDGNADTTIDKYDTDCNCVGFETCETLNATYEGEVLNILKTTCAYEGCHINYLVYDSLKIRTDNGKFEEKVLNPNTGPLMPPATVPEDKPISLTNEQLQVLQCWKDGGYQKN